MTECRTYSLAQVCDVLGISKSTLKRLRRHRAFPVAPVVGIPNRYPAKQIDELADGIHAPQFRAVLPARKGRIS